MQASWGDVILAPVANCTVWPRKQKLAAGNTVIKTTIKTFYVNTGRPRDHNGKSFQKIRSVRQVTSCFALKFFSLRGGGWISAKNCVKRCSNLGGKAGSSTRTCIVLVEESNWYKRHGWCDSHHYIVHERPKSVCKRYPRNIHENITGRHGGFRCQSSGTSKGLLFWAIYLQLLVEGAVSRVPHVQYSVYLKEVVIQLVKNDMTCANTHGQLGMYVLRMPVT